jgi:hypothetical protein
MSTPINAAFEGGAMQQTPSLTAAADEHGMGDIPRRSMRGKLVDSLCTSPSD